MESHGKVMEFYYQISVGTLRFVCDRDSLHQGWKALMVLTAFFDCTENLRPYLFKYVEETAYDHSRPCHGEAPLVSSPYSDIRQ